MLRSPAFVECCHCRGAWLKLGTKIQSSDLRHYWSPLENRNRRYKHCRAIRLNRFSGNSATGLGLALQRVSKTGFNELRICSERRGAGPSTTNSFDRKTSPNPPPPSTGLQPTPENVCSSDYHRLGAIATHSLQAECHPTGSIPTLGSRAGVGRRSGRDPYGVDKASGLRLPHSWLDRSSR